MCYRPIASIATVLMTATACATNSPDVAMALQSDASSVDTPVPGAVPETRETILNSDNRSIVVRTGINSDPNDPNGTPRPQVTSIYDVD
jgi:hypothetical protein